MARKKVSDSENRYYVYEVLVDGVVRYVGKGTKSRRHHHRKIARQAARRIFDGLHLKGLRSFHKRLALALLAGSEITSRIVIDGLTSGAAYLMEIDMIAEQHKAGNLWNVTGGGDGFSVEMLADPTGYWASLEAAWKDPERRRLAKENAIARWQDATARENHSAILTEAYQNPEVKERHRAAIAKRWINVEDRRAFNSAAAKANWAKPGTRERQAEWARQAQKRRNAIRLAAFANGLLGFGA